MAIKIVQAIINGTTYTLTLNSQTGYYEADITAPAKSSYNINSGHYYPVTVKATDTANNVSTVNDTHSTLGASCRLIVKEVTKPVISITAPTDSQRMTNNKPTVTWTVTDDDSGVNPDTIGITIDSGSKVTSGITKTAITGGYRCSYVIPSALSDGSHTIKCDALDYDGNAATQRGVTFIVDTVPPALSVTSPVNNLVTNSKTITLSGKTSDATSSPVLLTVKLNSGSAQTVDVGSDGAFSKTLTLTEGANTILVTATDSAGKTTSITRTVTLDTKAPVISEIILPSKVNAGASFKVQVKVTD